MLVSQPVLIAGITCLPGTFSSQAAALSSDTCTACTQHAMSPPGSNASGMCTCSAGFTGACTMSRVDDLLRTRMPQLCIFKRLGHMAWSDTMSACGACGRSRRRRVCPLLERHIQGIIRGSWVYILPSWCGTHLHMCQELLLNLSHSQLLRKIFPLPPPKRWSRRRVRKCKHMTGCISKPARGDT